jgi:Flp pilus assembly protein TadG
MTPRRSLSGQALAELAVVVPILLLVALCCVGMGRLIQARMGLSAATREAARATALAPKPKFC